MVHEGGYSRDALGYTGLLPIYYENLLRYVRKHMNRGAVFLMRVAIAKGMLLRMAIAMVAPRLSGTTRSGAVRAYCRVLALSLSP